jgi:hypothetical protein
VIEEGMTLELIAKHMAYPKKVYVAQVKNDKVWLLDIPRTMAMPRYLHMKEISAIYREVID